MGGIPHSLRVLAAHSTKAVAWLLVASATIVRADTISVTLDLTDDPAKNRFVLAIEGEGGRDEEIATLQGSMDVALDMEFDATNHQPKNPTKLLVTGGAWSVNDLAFKQVTADGTYTATTTGIRGDVWSMAPSLIADGAFSASDLAATINAGTAVCVLDPADPALPDESIAFDFAGEPYTLAGPDYPISIAVSLMSVEGNTATYRVVETIPVSVESWPWPFAVSASGFGEATGLFTRSISGGGDTEIKAGDIDRDFDVDIFDVAILQTNYGMTAGATWAEGDFDGNGTVDIFDVALMQVNYGYGVGNAPTPVPEPSALVLAGMGLLGAVILWRRR